LQLMTLDWGNRWRAGWELLGIAAPEDDLLASLLGEYGASDRFYHTLQHLGECLDLFEEAIGLAERPGEVALALWFHDAVYDTRRSNNESRSADWAEGVLLKSGGSSESATRVRQLIMATRHAESPAPGDAALLVDIDLAILGAPPTRFEEYEIQIHREYHWVPDLVFRPTRARILQGFLERDRIYSTTPFAARLEAAARANLLRALARLSA
jgi:predicted metal-dependent HD superfamily phosphohydrolase